MIFEVQLRNGLDSLFINQHSQLKVDDIESIADDCLLVTFHMAGAWGGPASFTFPFSASIPLEDSLAAIQDMISRNWNTARIAPRAKLKGAG